MSEIDTCPSCGDKARRVTNGVEPWCGSCEWNLGAFDPREGQPRGWIARRSHRITYSLNGRLHKEIVRARPGRPTVSASSLALYALSVLMSLVVLALLALGVWAVVTGPGLEKFFGVLLLLIVIELRPRFARLPKYHVAVTRETAPALWRLVDDATDALDAPRLHQIVLVDEFNASASTVGVRRRRVLALGVPLWAALGDDARLALLGHELGHFVNGDPTRSLLGQPATASFARLSGLLRPDRVSNNRRVGRSDVGSLVDFADVLSRYLLAKPLSGLFRTLHLGVLTVAARDRIRAEFYADALALRLGGSVGATELMEVLVLSDATISAIRVSSRQTGTAEQWRAAVQATLAAQRPRLTTREQVSIRYNASLFASHPPAGLRLRAVRAWSSLAPVPRTAIDIAADDPIVLREQRRMARDLARS